MAEVCFVFFNNKIQSLYTIPNFYNEPFNLNDSKKMERLEYYNNNKKNISAMMGHICQLLIYLSKTFNIPLRFIDLHVELLSLSLITFGEQIKTNTQTIME